VLVIWDFRGWCVKQGIEDDISQYSLKENYNL